MNPTDVFPGLRVVIRSRDRRFVLARDGQVATVVEHEARNCWRVEFADGRRDVFNAYWLDRADGAPSPS